MGYNSSISPVLTSPVLTIAGYALDPIFRMQDVGELNDRARRILVAVVKEYIATAEPVGSRAVSRRYERTLSAATIRSVLADLDELGYVTQPHTSAGRVPLERGFRLFVDALVQLQQVSDLERNTIEQSVVQLRSGGPDAMRAIGQALSELAGAAALVLPPGPEQEPLAQLRFVVLQGRQVLAVIVTTSGTIENRILEIEAQLSLDETERIHNYMEQWLDGRTLKELRDAVAQAALGECGRVRALSRRVAELLTRTLDCGRRSESLLVEGEAALFEQPEFAEVEQVCDVLNALKDRERLLELLDRTLAAEKVQVWIGSELPFENQHVALSAITAGYGQPGRPAGSVALLGPARMDYGRLMPLVKFTAEAMGVLLTERKPRGSC